MRQAAVIGEARVISTTRDKVGECPVWDGQAQALYWVDIEGRYIRRWNAALQTQESWEVPERVGCIALSTRGTVIAAMETGVFEVRLLEGERVDASLLAPNSHVAEGMRFNDGRCDAQGRFWLTTMRMDMALASPVGALYCLDERGLSKAHVDGLITPNGMAFSPDGRTMYLSDSHPTVQKIWAFDFDVAAGTLSNRRLFIDMTPLPGRPDGAAVDADGCYWICGNDAGVIHRFDVHGQLVASVTVPVPKPSMCAFGGADLQTLFVASIQPAGALPDDKLSGAVFALDRPEKGLPEPRFARFPVVSV
jgi:sugar lactone lactonase YvrE